MAASSARSVSTSRLKFPPAANGLGTLEMIDPRRIKVDPSYQRPQIAPHIRNIAMNFDYGSLKAINVNRRPDGSLFAVDGHQEVCAAVLRGDIPKVPCYVTRLNSVEKEAKAFGDMNGNRKRLTALALHRGKVCAGHPQSIAVAAACHHAGVELVMGKSSGGNKCNAVGSLVQWAGKRKPAEIRAELGSLFKFLFTAWPGDPKVLSGRFVMGVLRLLSQAGEDGKARILTQPQRLGRNAVDYYVHRASIRADANDKTIVAELPQVLREAFNRKLPEKSRI